MNSSTAIYLVGARASGKTTTGKKLAQILSCPFVDTDELIRQQSGQEIAQIVAAEGWPGFRRRESQALVAARQVLDKRPPDTSGKVYGVIATGGGMVLAKTNRDFMRATGHVVWLAPPVEILVGRLLADPLESQRPSLTGGDLAGETRQVLAGREALYRGSAHLVIAGAEAVAPAEQICSKILQAIR